MSVISRPERDYSEEIKRAMLNSISDRMPDLEEIPKHSIRLIDPEPHVVALPAPRPLTFEDITSIYPTPVPESFYNLLNLAIPAVVPKQVIATKKASKPIFAATPKLVLNYDMLKRKAEELLKSGQLPLNQ